MTRRELKEHLRAGRAVTGVTLDEVEAAVGVAK